MYFDLDSCLAEDMFLSFVTSERGAGKTFSTLKRLIENFIEKGEQFVYVRRTQTEIDLATPTMFEPFKKEGFFEDVSLTVKGDFFYCDNKVMGRAMAISTAFKYKSVGFPMVKYIVFDEFISEDKKYLKEEVTKFLSLIETIGRMRDVRVICLANQNTIYNPYYLYFNVRPHSPDTAKTRFRTAGILIYQFSSTTYREAKKDTKFGNLIKGTKYGDFMLDNKAIHDDYSMIDKLGDKKKFPFVNMLIEGKNVVAYDVMVDNIGIVWFQIREKIDGIPALNFDKMLVEDRSIDRAMSNPYTKRCLFHLKRSNARFANMETKLLIQNFIF